MSRPKRDQADAALKRLFRDFTNPVLTNRERAVSAAVALILEVPDQWFARLRLVSEWALTYHVGRGSSLDALRGSFRELVRGLDEGGRHDLLLDLERYLNDGIDPLTPWDALTPADRTRIHVRRGDPRQAWTTIVLNAYYAYIGRSFNLSLAWGLRLLGWLDDLFATEVNTLVSTFAVRELIIAFVAPPSELLPVKRWLEQIVRALGDREEARQIFRDLNGMFDALRRASSEWRTPAERMRLEVCLQEPLTTSAEDMAQVEQFVHFMSGPMMADRSQLKLHIATADYVHLQASGTIDAARAQTRLDTAGQASAWLASHRERALRTRQDQWREICERPERMPRPGRLDFVEINVPVLHHAGVRGVILNAEEGFPDIVLEIYLRERTPHLRCYRRRVSEILATDLLPMVAAYLDIPTLAEIFRIVLIDICHRIICRDEDFPPHPGGSAFGATATAEVIRRAHRRQLLPGQSVSREARARAAAANFPLEEGYTFVKAVVKEDGTLGHDLPSRPFALYTETDYERITLVS